MDNQFFNKQKSLKIKSKIFLRDLPVVMGILNITDDSFYDGGRYNAVDKALSRVEEMLIQGADIIDIGAQSSRPGAVEKGSDHELKLLIPVLNAIEKRFPDAVVSIDTWHSAVARETVAAGADIINDISGGTFDDEMFETIADLNIPYVLMHTGDRPEEMQKNPYYDDVTAEVIRFLSQQLDKLNILGVSDVIIDPGFGFGKTLKHNYELLNSLEHFKYLERPLLVGISRKSMIYKLLNGTPEDSLTGTIALNAIALLKGADILRVHDVKEAGQVVKLVAAMT